MKKPEEVVETDPELIRIQKLNRYYEHFEVSRRFDITFPQFIHKVETGAWASRFPDYERMRDKEAVYAK